MDEKPQFMTADSKLPNGRVHDDDVRAMSGVDGIMMVSPDQLRHLAARATERKSAFDAVCARIVTMERANEIRDLRCAKSFSWRALSQECFNRWGTTLDFLDYQEWTPPSNQLMGMALCQTASWLLDETID